MKLKKYYLIFLVLYLLVLILAGANRMIRPDTVLSKARGFIWSLMPSQTAGWWFISLIVLVILIILVFVAGCKLIAYFVRKEKDQRSLKLKFRNYIGVAVGFLFIASALVPMEGQPLDNDFETKPHSQSMLHIYLIIALTSIFVSLILKIKFRNHLGIAVGLLFIASALVPLGGYHLENSDVPVTGVLWNFMVPTGWIHIVVGVILLFQKRLGLENKRLAFVLFAAGLFYYPLLFRQNVDYWLGLWRGVSGGFDVDSFGWIRLMLYFPFCVALTSILTSLLVMINGSTKSQNHPS